MYTSISQYTAIHKPYIRRLGNKFRLITSHYQAFAFKNHSTAVGKNHKFLLNGS
jgi:hypothetical protein